MYIYMFVIFVYAIFMICETIFCWSELADGSGLGKWDVVESALVLWQSPMSWFSKLLASLEHHLFKLRV